MQFLARVLVSMQALVLLVLLTGCEVLATAKIVPDPNNTTDYSSSVPAGRPTADPVASLASPCSHSSGKSELEADVRQLREEQSNNSRLLTDRLDALRQLLTYSATHPLDAVLLGKLERLERQLGERSDLPQRHEDSAVGSALPARPTHDVTVASYQLVKDELTQLRSRMESQRNDQEAQKLQLESQRLELEKLRQSQQKSVEGLVGTSYIRWGRTTCNGDATTVYRGYSSGSKHDVKGGASNLLCLHETPQWNRTIQGTQGYSSICGVEYRTNDVFSNVNNGGQSLLYHPGACAVCHVPNRSTKIMIPARRDCPSGFTKEYNGYIMADHIGHLRSSYECWDDAPETMPGASIQTQALVYQTEVVCGSLPCSKFVSGFELTCVVCTK